MDPNKPGPQALDHSTWITCKPISGYRLPFPVDVEGGFFGSFSVAERGL